MAADVAFEQRSEIEFGGGDIDTRQQGAVKHDLETVVAHAEASLSRFMAERSVGQPSAGRGWFSAARLAQLRCLFLRLAVFGIEAGNQFIDARQVIDFTDALAGGPYGFPGFGFIAEGFELGAEVDFAFALQRCDVETGIFQALAHEACRYAGHCWSMHDVCGSGCQQHLFVGVRRMTFGGADKSRAEVGQVGAEQLCGENFVAVVQAPGQQQGFVEELADLGDQRERAPGPGMPAGTRGDGDQAVYTGLGGFFGMAASRHIMEHQAAVAVHRIDQLPSRRRDW